jgi:NADH-quinone oxidoreductase subunit L
MLAILVVLPLVISAFLALAMKRNSNYIKYISLIASIISLMLIISLFFNASQAQNLTWFRFLGYSFTLTTSTMPLNMVLLLIVGIITPLIMLYSIGFMNLPSEQPRFYSELSIFATSMLLFAMAGDFITMMIGWELLGITSYLLIGFWYRREGTAEAARKAITTVLIGDILMFFAMFIIWNSYHTFTFAVLLQQTAASNPMRIALIMIIFAAFTKSAQFPFHEWLPDAMKGPTPVSAFLHSSTMVKAGVFLVAVLFPLFVSYHLLYLLLACGMITAILGAANALVESHIKRVLAYSTLEDLGLMFVALGIGSLMAAMLLFVVQTFYKALLFMSAGSIIKANNNEENMGQIYNTPSYPMLFIPTVIGAVSLAGLYPLSGFFGRTAVDVAANNIIIYLILLVIGLASNIYIFRWLFVPLHKKPYKKITEASANYKTMPLSMMTPIYILAIIVAISGFAIYMYLPAYLGHYGIHPIKFSIFDIIISTAIIIFGFLLSYALFYRKEYALLDEQNLLHKLLYNNLVTNKIYIYITKLAISIAEVMEAFDHALYNIIKEGGHNINMLGDFIKRIETGNARTYIAVFVIGLIIVVAIFIL